MGDRTPSQFYRDLRKLVPSSVSDDFVLATWKKYLPVNIQYVLTTLRITETNALIKKGDSIHGRHPKALTATVSRKIRKKFKGKKKNLFFPRLYTSEL